METVESVEKEAREKLKEENTMPKQELLRRASTRSFDEADKATPSMRSGGSKRSRRDDTDEEDAEGFSLR